MEEQKKPGKAKGCLSRILYLVIVVIVVVVVRVIVTEGVDAIFDFFDNKKAENRRENTEEVFADNYGNEGLAQKDKLSDDEPNPEYMAVFEEAGLTDVCSFDKSMDLDFDSLVNVDEDGFIYRYEFASDGDTVCHMADTTYCPISYYEGATAEEIIQHFEEQFADVKEMDFCRLIVEQQGDYVAIIILQQDVDIQENLQALVDSGYLSLGSDGPAEELSLSASLKGMQAEGCIRK